MRTPDPLAAAIDRLYDVFADVPKPTTVEGCSHCFTEAEAAALLAPVPLRELSFKALSAYMASVLFTVGEAADFRYFLPRMLDLACTDLSTWPDLGSLGSRFLIAGWSTWTPLEQTAIRDLLHAHWNNALAGQTGDHSADSVLEDISELEDDITPYLQEWSSSLHQSAAADGLRTLLRYSSRPIEPGFPRLNARDDEHTDQLIQWLHSPELTTALHTAHANPDDEATRHALADIIDLLEHKV